MEEKKLQDWETLHVEMQLKEEDRKKQIKRQKRKLEFKKLKVAQRINLKEAERKDTIQQQQRAVQLKTELTHRFALERRQISEVARQLHSNKQGDASSDTPLLFSK